MPGVVALDDVFAAVVELAVSEKKAEAAEREVVLVVALDGVRNDGKSDFVLRPMPAVAGIVTAEFHGLVHFGIREGFVLPFIPSEAAAKTQVRGHLLLGVVAKAILERAEAFMQGDGGSAHSILRRVRAVQEVLDCLAIGSHVRAIGVEENALRAFVVCDDSAAQLELGVLAVSSTQGPIHIDSIGD